MTLPAAGPAMSGVTPEGIRMLRETCWAGGVVRCGKPTTSDPDDIGLCAYHYEELRETSR